MLLEESSPTVGPFTLSCSHSPAMARLSLVSTVELVVLLTFAGVHFKVVDLPL